MSLILNARRFAEEAHDGQVRKYTGEPYINHPVNVAKMVLSSNAPSEVIAAALLHDVVEDTPVTINDISREFGIVVSSLVEEVVDISRAADGNRAIRKEIDRQHLACASPEGKTIKLADLIDNTSSIIEYDKDFAVVYMCEKKSLLEVLADGDEHLYKVASGIVKQYYS